VDTAAGVSERLVSFDAPRAVVLAARGGRRSNRFEKAARERKDWRLERVMTGDAVLHALGTSCQLLLVDADLPVLSAFELCRIIRSRPETSDLPVIVLDFNGADNDREAMTFSSGGDDYVDAASGLSSIFSRIRSVLLRRHSSVAMARASSNEYSDRHLAVNFDTAIVTVDGVPIALQRLEFLLLRYFARRRNQLVSREELRRDVWNGKGTLDSRTIDVHVCRLRRKLGPAGDHIQTVVALGYRFLDAKPESRLQRISAESNAVKTTLPRIIQMNATTDCRSDGSARGTG
jgi:DNA-binding response OmpR family regulator